MCTCIYISNTLCIKLLLKDEFGIFSHCQVEKGNCQYLLLNGLDDQAMHPKSSEHIVKRLQKFGKTNYRHIEYPGTGHLIEPPHSPHFYATYHGMFSKFFVPLSLISLLLFYSSRYTIHVHTGIFFIEFYSDNNPML